MKIILLFAFLCSAAFADTYEVAYQKGTVEIFRDKKLVAPPVRPGDVVKVGRGSLLVLKGNGEVLKIMHDTVITPRETQEGTLIDLAKGAIVSQVTKKNFRIRNRSTIFGVRGTQFFVAAAGAEDSWMCVNEGVVNVTKDKNSVDVPKGLGVFVDPKSISKPQAYAWTKGINWKMDSKEGDLDHKVNLNYDLLENFYD